MKTLYARTGESTFTIQLNPDGRASLSDAGPTPLEAQARYLGHGRVELCIAGRRALAWAVDDGDSRWVFVEGEVFRVEVSDRSTRAARRTRSAGSGSLGPPMPATVVRVLVAPGQVVKQGETLLLLEAMKMELPLRAPRDGVVQRVQCAEGDLVQPGSVLVDLSAAERPAPNGGLSD